MVAFFRKLDRWFIHSGLVHFMLAELYVVDEGIDVAALNGNPHETTSAACGHNLEQSKPCLFCRLVCGFIQNWLGRIWPKLKTHCPDSWAAEKKMVEDSPPL